MPVSLNFPAISAVVIFAVLAACKPAVEAPKVSPQLSYDALSDQIGKIDVNIASFDELPGETRAEKLLYQAGIVSQMQTAMLVMFDTQEKAIRISGNTVLADELVETRGLLMEAVDTELGSMIKEAGLLYEEFLEPEEIERLIVLHSDPAMQKLILSQPKIAQSMIPIGENFGLRIGAKYDELARARPTK